MVKQITEDIYSIGVPLSGNPLKELNQLLDPRNTAGFC